MEIHKTTKKIKTEKKTTRDKKSKLKKQSRTRNTLSVLWLSVLIIYLICLLFIPKEIAYPANRNDLALLLPVVTITFWLVFGTTKSFGSTNGEALGYAIFSIGISLMLPAILHDYREEKELSLYGKVDKCIVIARKTEVEDKNAWLIKCSYAANGEEFVTYFHNEKNKKYKVGDTLEITYSKDFPNMYRINFE
ncbi:hypothetical protein [Bernardetia sp.]|uniref:hypothetical protein n=1 Tax=Bernardetia sp. TaxID=1937974 RepID=UPI0025C327B0|nr:hypothetical protein [Bernardetia sp.]